MDGVLRPLLVFDLWVPQGLAEEIPNALQLLDLLFHLLLVFFLHGRRGCIVQLRGEHFEQGDALKGMGKGAEYIFNEFGIFLYLRLNFADYLLRHF